MATFSRVSLTCCSDPHGGHPAPFLHTLNHTPMRCILPTAFAAFAVLLGTATLHRANATINVYHEQTAEALCKADPAWCGEPRR